MPVLADLNFPDYLTVVAIASRPFGPYYAVANAPANDVIAK